MKRLLSIVFATVLFAAVAGVSGYGVCTLADAGATDYASDNYYGSQLDTIDELSCDVYNELADYYVMDKCTGNYTYTFEEPYVYTTSDSQQFEENLKSIFLPPAYALIMDYPELFWVENFTINVGVKRTAGDDGVYTYTVSTLEFVPQLYYENADNDIDEFDAAVDDAVAEITQSLTDDADEYDKVKAVHDYLCDMLTYSKAAIRTPATVFIGEGEAICEGYSKAFKILCDKIGIECILVNGRSNNYSGAYEQHMWNDVLIDGTWYGMDVAWDDQGEETMYIYFLTGNQTEGFFDIYSTDHLGDSDYWGDGYFIVKYPELSDSSYRNIETPITSFYAEEISDMVYEGQEIEPTVTIKIMERQLVEGTDYTVQYKNNLDVGTADVIVTGIGRYTGTKDMTFSITPKDIGNATVTYGDYEYTGTAIKPDVKVTSGEKTLTMGVDYTLEYGDNIDIGQGTVTINGIGNYTGTKTIRFNITKISLSGLKIYGMKSVTYTGSAIKPVISSVVYGGKTLISGTDYTISYKNNTNVGTASIVITGKGNYTGSVTANFKITAKSISSVSVSTISNKTYTGQAIKPSVTVKDKTKTLKKGTDYTLSYSNNKKTGKATVTITGKGNYKGTKKVTFNIVPKKISLKTPTSPSKGKIKIKWTKNSTVKGYQIQYSTSKTFKNAKTLWVKSYKTTTKTVSKLKSGKTYYVRIRGYITVDGSKKYGAWTVKKVKTK